MRYAILSDIHGNLEALRAVLQDIDFVNRQVGVRVAQIWCLGDIVGYGPWPGECVEQVSRRCDICVAGNHDWAAIRKIDLNAFSDAAANSATWTRERLTTVGFNYLKSLRGDRVQIGNFTLAHGSPYDPIWEYLTTPDAAANSFQYFDTLYCVVGHTHLPAIFTQKMVDRMAPLRAIERNLNRKVALTMAIAGGPTRSSLEADEYSTGSRVPATTLCDRWQPTPGVWQIPAQHRAIINPGSVGQPRDGDNRASYVIYDSEQGFEFRRVPYNFGATQRKIYELGLPGRLAERLETAN